MNRTVGDITVAYRESGPTTGPLVVFVHGIGQDGASWQPTFDALAELHCLAPDVRGHGGTELGSAHGTLAQLAADLAGFLETVCGPAVCVGFSLGGTIALAAAVARPELVPRLVLMGTSSVVGRSAAAFYERRAGEASDPVALAAGVRSDTVAGLYRSGHDVDALVADRLRAIGDGRGFANACRAMARFADAPLTPALPSVAAPVTVIGAEHDRLCPRKAADILVAGLPDARYVEIADSSHLVALERPAAVVAAIRGAVRG